MRSAGDAVVEPGRVVAVVGRQRCPVACVGPLEDVHHQRRVGDAHRVRPEVGDGAERRQRVRRHPPEARLEPDVAAEGGRDAHRPGAVGADAERSEAGRHRRRGAARRPTRRLRRIPRVARDAGQIGVGLPLAAELGRRRLAEQDGAGLAQAGRRRRVDVPRLLGVDRVAAAARRPALGEDEVLDRRRHAVERPDGLAALPADLARRGVRQRLVGGDVAERVERRVQRLDAVEDGLRRPRPARPTRRRRRRAARWPCAGSGRSSGHLLEDQPGRSSGSGAGDGAVERREAVDRRRVLRGPVVVEVVGVVIGPLDELRALALVRRTSAPRSRSCR